MSSKLFHTTYISAGHGAYIHILSGDLQVFRAKNGSGGLSRDNFTD